MKKMITRVAVCLLLIPLLLGGMACRTQGPYAPLKHGTSLEETESLVLLDKPLQKMVSVDSQRAGYTPDGRMVAEAVVRNNSSQTLNIQAQTVFKDGSGFSSGDETAWETLILQPNAQSTYRASALNKNSAKYTIRIRMER